MAQVECRDYGAPTARRGRQIIFRIDPQPFRGWAHVLSTGPPGLASVAIFAVSSLTQVVTGKATATTDKKARRVLRYPTQAKNRLEWGTQRQLGKEKTAGPLRPRSAQPEYIRGDELPKAHQFASPAGKAGCPLPRFPAETCGVDTSRAPLLNDRRTRGTL